MIDAPGRAEPAANEPRERGDELQPWPLLGNFAVSYQDDAFFQDVLDARYHGTTEPFTAGERRRRREIPAGSLSARSRFSTCSTRACSSTSSVTS